MLVSFSSLFLALENRRGSKIKWEASTRDRREAQGLCDAKAGRWVSTAHDAANGSRGHCSRDESPTQKGVSALTEVWNVSFCRGEIYITKFTILK